MKASLKWLQEWVDVGQSAAEIEETLTMLGLEVDSVSDESAGIEDIVVARVEQVDAHPQADRLHVCTVFDGTDRHTVVCGAPNVAANITAPFIRVGSKLPDGTKIRSAKLRGVKSNGMLCSGRELGLSEDASGLMLLDSNAEIGARLIDHLQLNDVVFDVDLTPNRGDCFSMLGIARELAAKTATELNEPQVAAVAADIPEEFPVQLLADDACPVFCSRIVRGIDNTKASPLWLQERLRRAGLRAINPVVDVTNLVMLEFGQPLHAYDLSRLKAPLSVRWAKENEQIALLNEKTVELSAQTLVIADAGAAVGLAGIMGGAGTATQESTCDVLLESAWFAPAAIAGRARTYGIHTDASVRFERGVDPTQQQRAIERATALLLEIAGGRTGPAAMTVNAHYNESSVNVPLRLERAQRVLGIELDADAVEIMLKRLGIALKRNESGWIASVPPYRFDLRIEEDLIEEIGRLVGYDSIPVTAGTASTHLGTSTELTLQPAQLTDLLVERGYVEIISYSFTDEKRDSIFAPDVERAVLANPISMDLNVMRSTLWPGLVDTARRNHAHQIEDLRLMEFGPQFDAQLSQKSVLAGLAVGQHAAGSWSGDRRNIDFYDVKADIEALLAVSLQTDDFRFVPSEHPALRPGQAAEIFVATKAVGWIGALHPSIQIDLGFKNTVYLFSLNVADICIAKVPSISAYSRYPHIRRDLAVVVPETISAAEIVDVVRRSAGPLLEDIVVFDVYRGPGLDATAKSIALGLILQDASRTLTDGDADSVVSTVTENLGRDLGATIRT